MNPFHKQWNEQQKILRAALDRRDGSAALPLFNQQHAALHAAAALPGLPWSFEDETLDGLADAQWRAIPPGGEHSIAWAVWHVTRIEDVVANIVLAGGAQLLDEGWQPRLCISRADTGNVMDVGAVEAMSAAVDVGALRAYRMAVGIRTREVVASLPPETFWQKTREANIQRVTAQNLVFSQEVLDYWRGLTGAGVLLMPFTRHIVLHWNEAQDIRKQVTKA